MSFFVLGRVKRKSTYTNHIIIEDIIGLIIKPNKNETRLNISEYIKQDLYFKSV